MREECVRNRLANDLLRYHFVPVRDIGTTIGLSWLVGHEHNAVSLMMHNLMKSCASVARYLRQPISWVEQLSLEELNRWAEVTGELLLEERGGSNKDVELRGPYGFPLGDD